MADKVDKKILTADDLQYEMDVILSKICLLNVNCMIV